jgi:hypothetical protein
MDRAISAEEGPTPRETEWGLDADDNRNMINMRVAADPARMTATSAHHIALVG